MNYYPFHLGDYAAHTAHLEPMEDLAYRRLLDQYYLRECALPADIQATAKLVRMRSCVADVEAVLNEFFVLTEDGWKHSRCDAEIERMQDKQAKARASAQASVNARKAKSLNVRSTDGSDESSERSTDAEKKQTDVELPTPTPIPTPITNTPSDEGVAQRKRSATAARPDDVSEPVWQDFQRLRREKRAPLTDTALAGVRREAEKAGISLQEALECCCEVGWQGFNAGWYADRKGLGMAKRVDVLPHNQPRYAAAAQSIYEGVNV